MAPKQPESRQAQQKRRQLRFLPEAGCLALIALFWIIYVSPIVVTEKRRGGDIVRDVAAAVNIQQGQWLSDPAYRGETTWYPPLSPMLVAGLSALIHLGPLEIYRWSELLFNWLIPVGLFLLVRRTWGLRVAMGSTVALLLAMPWWQIEVIQGQPAIHAVVWGWAALLLYGLQHKRASMGWAVCCGLFQGLSFWHHPLVPATLAGTFILQAAWAWRHVPLQGERTVTRTAIVQRNLVILGLTVVVAAPVLYLMMHGPVLNRAPREYLAAELKTVEFALMRGNPWIWATGLIGLAASIRRGDIGSRMLVIWVGLCTLAQAPGYLRLYGPEWAAHLPIFVPHEFQRLFQVGWAIAVGVGIDVLLNALIGQLAILRAHQAVGALFTLLALAITGTGGLLHARENLRHSVQQHVLPPALDDAAVWIRQNTNINDVFVCSPVWAFEWLCPQTGRKVWVTSPGHSNPRVDWNQRVRVLVELASTPSPERFSQLVQQNGIDYCLISSDWHPRVLSDRTSVEKTIPAYLTVAYSKEGIWIFKVNK